MSLNLGHRLLKPSASSSCAMRCVGILTGNRNFHSSPPRAVVFSNADLPTFTNAIKAKDRISVVDFYADWCGPCHQLGPVVEKLTNEPNKSGSGLPFDLVKVDVESEDGQALGLKYKIRAMPTVIAFRDGAPVSQFVGALPEVHVKNFLDQL